MSLENGHGRNQWDSWELLYRFYWCFPDYTLCNLSIYINTIIRKRPQYPKRVNICHTQCKISLYQHTKPRKNSSCQKNPRTLSTQNSSKKGHNYFFSTYFDLKQLHIQFKILLTNKRVCNGYYLCPTLCKYLYGLLQREIYLPITRNTTTLYLCYIDDIILIWTKSENELLTFFEKLNQQHPSIKFEMKYFKDKIEYLDTLIYKDKNSNIQTTLYKKPTDHQNYIHSKSAHPFSLKKSIAYIQLSITSEMNLLNNWGA